MRFCTPPRRLKVCGFLLAALSLCALPQRAWAQYSPSIQKIDLSGSGHVRCKENQGSLLPALEMDQTAFPQFYTPSAGIRQGNLTGTFTLHHTAGQPAFSGKRLLEAVLEYPDFPNPNGQIPISVSPAEQSFTVAGGGTTNLTCTLGALPSEVRGGSLRVQYTFKTPEGAYLHSQTDFLPFYVLYDTPTAPQENPWEGVLYDACKWAGGENTHDGVAEELTQGVFFSQRFAYPGNTASYWMFDTNFRVADFLATSGWQSGNCDDVSAFLAICANAVGLDFEVVEYREAFFADWFDTNHVCLIGGDPTLGTSYQQSSWSRHMIARPVGTTLVYDACAAQWWDLTPAQYQNPPAGWPIAGYWFTDPSWPIGLVFLPNPSTPWETDAFTPGVL